MWLGLQRQINRTLRTVSRKDNSRSYRRKHTRRAPKRGPSRFRRPELSKRHTRRRIRERDPGFVLTSGHVLLGSGVGLVAFLGVLAALGWDGLVVGECFFSAVAGCLLGALAILLRHVAEGDRNELEAAAEE